MYKLCKTEQSARRQRELEQGLLAAMENHYYEEISVSDLCDQLQIPRKSFYRYFSNKEGALHALIDHSLLEFESFLPDGYDSGNRSSQMDLERFFRFWKEKHLLLDALSRSGISGTLVIRAVDHAMSDVGVPSRFLLQDQQQTRRYATMFGVCGLMSLVLNWHAEGFAVPESEMAAIATELMTRPLFAQSDTK